MGIPLDEFYRQKGLTDKGVEAKLEALSKIISATDLSLEDSKKPIPPSDLLKIYESTYKIYISREVKEQKINSRKFKT